jgi:hypothetical protein
MKHLNDFETFNENFFTKFGAAVRKLFRGIGRLIVGDSSLGGALGEYDIKVDKIDNHTFKFYHNNRLVARVFQPDGDEGTEMNRPVFKIYIYLYEKEINNTKSLSMRVTDPDKEISVEISKQDERPYYKLAKRHFQIDWLIQTFYEWWASKTKSGRAVTQKLNKAEQKPTPLKHFEPGRRTGYGDRQGRLLRGVYPKTIYR